MKGRPYTDEDFHKLNHVHLTSDNVWDPSKLNRDLTVEDLYHSPIHITKPSDIQAHPDFDLEGNIVQDPLPNNNISMNTGEIRNVTLLDNLEEIIDHDELHFDLHDESVPNPLDLQDKESVYNDWNYKRIVQQCCYRGYHDETEDWLANTFEGNHYNNDDSNHWKANPIPRETKASEVDYNALQPQFCWLPSILIKKTFQATTQFAKLPASAYLWKRFKSPHPANNVWRRNEDVASDTLFSDTPAIDSGVKCAQIFFWYSHTRYRHRTDEYLCRISIIPPR